MAHSRTPRLFAVSVALAAASLAGSARAADKTLQDYRWFRALSIDLVGRIPTRAEVAAFESADFDADAWIDEKLLGAGYADRVRSIYVDQLRLDFGKGLRVLQQHNVLRRHRVDIAMPGGTTKKTWVWWRANQRRTVAEHDRAFCFTGAELGQSISRFRPPVPEQPTLTIPLATVQARAVKVRPWWLYRDYKSAKPTEHYRTWSASEPRFRLEVDTDRPGPGTSPKDPRLLVDYDGAEVEDVWVCKEEAQATANVEITVRGATANVSCDSESGGLYSNQCGCGKGLERCLPGAGYDVDPLSIIQPLLAPLGPEEPLQVARTSTQDWYRRTWHEEAHHFLGSLFAEDHDFRDVLLAKYDWVNGPSAAYYRSFQQGSCCVDTIDIGPTAATFLAGKPLVDPKAMPAGLQPTEMDRWVKVEDRGPLAAGILTLPAFLQKYASRRGRANAVYNTFLCREFVADRVDLPPSNEANLMIREGCSTCHAKLEPMAAYFTRFKENSFELISAPIDNPTCAIDAAGAMGSKACAAYYDPAFSTKTQGQLRGAYGSIANVEKGPRGLAEEVTSAPEFASCATKTVVEGMLGRRTTPADDALLGELTQGFTDNGYRMRALVRAVVKSNAYKNANTAAEAK